MDLYAENILEHYRAPRGKLPLPAGEGWGEGFFQHTENNPACGDEITVGLTMHDDHIQDIHWDGTGCAISQAAMSMLSEELEGKSLDEVDALTKEDILTLLGVPIGPRRLKCALLGLHACKNALRKAEGRETLGWTQGILGEK